jgi:pre-rRNA-processing protein TSR3
LYRLASPGVVLSSEATTYLSPADLEVVQKHGIGGINCSWNRLDEIPFGKMGSGRTQRILPLLYAANSVNYGRPFKMNTAEAMAASLYIVGLKEDAQNMLYPCSYGKEFIRLNFEALEAYSRCSSSAEVEAISTNSINQKAQKKADRDVRIENDVSGCAVTSSYLNDDDMPPMEDDEYEYYEDEEDEAMVELAAAAAALNTTDGS